MVFRGKAGFSISLGDLESPKQGGEHEWRVVRAQWKQVEDRMCQDRSRAQSDKPSGDRLPKPAKESGLVFIYS